MDPNTGEGVPHRAPLSCPVHTLASKGLAEEAHSLVQRLRLDATAVPIRDRPLGDLYKAAHQKGIQNTIS